MKRDDSHERSEPKSPSEIQSISAVTLATHDMARAVRFYRALGFTLRTGGERSPFTSLSAGTGYLNITFQPPERSWSWWGRVIFYVADVDAFYEHAVAQGLHPDATPCDAPWGERYFHITDPDGHELSFARRLES
jgi:catechol 2,3-dioxygenase-like lactoylglutathione lyase family enzyme